MIASVLAIETIRRMRGGSQARLMRCCDGQYYVVKFQNNLQGTRILTNDFIGTQLAAWMGLPVPAIAVVEVHSNLIACEELSIEFRSGRKPCVAGRQFGSRYPRSPNNVQVFPLWGDRLVRLVEDRSGLIGSLVFDQWACNNDTRQAIFFWDSAKFSYQLLLIDQGFCFGAERWEFKDSPLWGIRRDCPSLYESVTSIQSFEPWLSRIECGQADEVLEEALKQLPPEWYEFDLPSLERMFDRLLRRRKRVRDLLVSAVKSSNYLFPNWHHTRSFVASGLAAVQRWRGRVSGSKSIPVSTRPGVSNRNAWQY